MKATDRLLALGKMIPSSTRVTASHFGISADWAVVNVHDGAGAASSFKAMFETAAYFRATGVVPDAPLVAIREGMKKGVEENDGSNYR